MAEIESCRKRRNFWAIEISFS